MKKFGKLLLGATVLTAVAGGVYVLYKKVKELKELDLEDLDLEEDLFEDDEEVSSAKSTDERDYINISVEAPTEESAEETVEEIVEEKPEIPVPTMEDVRKEIPVPTVTPVSSTTV